MPPQTPTETEGTKVSEWRRSKSSLAELVAEDADAVDAGAAVAVGVLILRL